MHTFALLASALALVLPAMQVSAAGAISSPANGTAIAPGQAFAFGYDIHADYCISSFNYTVWLFTSDPAKFSLTAGGVFSTGAFLGRFQQPNYPGAPPMKFWHLLSFH
jgi:hypothetical protein